MTRLPAWVLALIVSACQLKTSLPGATPASKPGIDDRAGGGRDDQAVTMPDLQGMTRDEAIAALKRAGIEPSSIDSDPSIACHDEQTPHGRVCYQSPIAGAQTLAHLSVTINVQQADPDSHTPGVPGAHYPMPDVRGLTVADARKKLAAAGLSSKDHVAMLITDDCPRRGVVCGQEPAPGATTFTEQPKLVRVQRDAGLNADIDDLFSAGN
jgi:beta-lactam-binding protein with PASTA domain